MTPLLFRAEPHIAGNATRKTQTQGDENTAAGEPTVAEGTSQHPPSGTVAEGEFAPENAAQNTVSFHSLVDQGLNPGPAAGDSDGDVLPVALPHIIVGNNIAEGDIAPSNFPISNPSLSNLEVGNPQVGSGKLLQMTTQMAPGQELRQEQGYITVNGAPPADPLQTTLPQPSAPPPMINAAPEPGGLVPLRMKITPDEQLAQTSTDTSTKSVFDIRNVKPTAPETLQDLRDGTTGEPARKAELSEKALVPFSGLAPTSDKPLIGAPHTPPPAPPSLTPSLAPSPAIAVNLQITQAMQSSTAREIHIRLDPAELGQVRIVMQPSEAGMMVTFFAERSDTLSLLEQNAHQLKLDLSDIGHENSEFIFEQEPQPKGEASQSQDISAPVEPALLHHEIQIANPGSTGLDLRL